MSLADPLLQCRVDPSHQGGDVGMKLPAPWQGQRRKDREPEARALEPFDPSRQHGKIGCRCLIWWNMSHVMRPAQLRLLRLAFRSSMSASAWCSTAYAMVAASPSSSVSVARPM